MPDSKAKTIQIISAYKTKAEGVSQVLNMPESPQLTSETPHAFAPSDNNVSQTKSYVKCAVVIDGHGRQNNKIIDSNAITSVHTRQNAITGLLKDAVNDEAAGNTSVYYIDAKKPPAYSSGLGYNCPVSCFAPMATFIVYAIPTQMSSQKLRM